MQRNSIWPKTFRKYRVTLAKLLYTFLAAFMLGISNVINQEDRTIHDTRFKIEKRQDQTEEED
ncbi:hypothetical protein [Maribacter cobaltidurans]|uniref:Uncharacterized protein n=1 Tax=Maribacter cobaltidurans TaxID=1178778 RepID=A0A223V1Y2_9FLAO|nr:hypothetical protein [Maribacter cobaltidurans]ASV29403.1 hypothetical protein CJ263_03715 [Maribacter cobaltidurans]GGD69391.1 hypothetical protein GCM10011412_03670 [Maribacter cobaltidurans]